MVQGGHEAGTGLKVGGTVAPRPAHFLDKPAEGPCESELTRRERLAVVAPRALIPMSGL